MLPTTSITFSWLLWVTSNLFAGGLLRIRNLSGSSTAPCRALEEGLPLTQRLLAFARRQDLKVEPTNIAELLRGMNELIERSIGSQIELAIEVPPALPSVLVDRNQIELAILNLVVNARDAMQNGGKLTIEVSRS